MPRSLLSVLIILALVILSTVFTAPAQDAASGSNVAETKSPPMQIQDYWKVMPHRLSPSEPIRGAATDYRGGFRSVPIEIVVDEQGNVVSAKIARQEGNGSFKDLYPAALEQARGWKYKPFEKDGKPVSATFTDYIRLLPMEEIPITHVPFPRVIDWGSLRITLERTSCFGSCPAYSVEVHGDGSVVYQGRGSVLVTGEHHDHISKDALAEILEAFRKADYLSLRDKYAYPVTDNPTTTTSITLNGTKKSVIDYVGEEVGMPHAVIELEETIDRVVGTARWIAGNAETVPGLMRENWDFKSRDSGLTLVRASCSQYRSSSAAGSPVVRELIAAGVPTNLHDDRGQSALGCIAAEKDKETLILLMEAGAARDNPELKNDALAGAAHAGDLQLVRLMLKYGADPNTVGQQGHTILMAAAASGVPAVVAEILKYHPDANARNSNSQTALHLATQISYGHRTEDERKALEKEQVEIVTMLVRAGADPHIADKDGNTPLHHAYIPVIAEALIKNGADVNARNHQGETPLMVTYSGDIARVLVQAGADLSARDARGRTALDIAQSRNDQTKLQILEAAQNASAGKAPQ